MKKLLVIFAALLLVGGVAAQAQASFSAGDLIRVVYQTTASGGSYEVATDLGSAAGIEAGTISLNSNTFNLFGTGTKFTSTDPTTLQVAYFAVDSGRTELWTSGPQGGTETNMGATQSSNIAASALNIYSQYSGTAAWLLKSAANSYYTKMDKSGTGIGSFDYWYATGSGDGEAQLAVGTVYQDIFDWTGITNKTQKSILGSFTLATSIDASGNITTTILPATGAAPIPPSFLLLVPGLLGLVGLRRRGVFNS